MGCDNRSQSGSSYPDAVPTPSEPASQQGQRQARSESKSASTPIARGQAEGETVSLNQADAIENQNQVADRKIIRNSDFIIETDDPTDGQRRITSIAESLNGFVVTSEFKQNDAVMPGRPGQVVKVTVRIPSNQFGQAIETIRGLGRVLDEKESGQDVTEEYIDLEARIRTKKALEAQFLEIMKQAKKVSEALEVQSQIADVRSEIESLEGRRRFLENRSALSTINITLQTAAPIVTATTRGFSHDVKQAFGDGIDLAASIVTGLIRLLIVMIPITIFILLPFVLLIRFAVRRIKWPKKTVPVTEPQ
jgi:hypothetical protein